ncbi:MAG: acetate--CoA ligase family protein, partial [Alphaproteobacteria bacterium]|nr:acetate--CoA ligase family protein [Alphaproteobacteria bacterium]
MPDLSALLTPSSVAVIGASPDPHSLRGRIMEVMGCHDVDIPIYPISRSHDEIMGLKAYKAIADTPTRVDLAILIIPAEHIPGALEDCTKVGVKAALILASGFAEDHSEGGEDLQQRVLDIQARTGMLICGPNSEGFANMATRLCATFSPAVEGKGMELMPAWSTAGRIAVVAQSGGMGFAFYDRARAKEMRFSHVVTTGNEACLESLDVVDHLITADEADVFLMFMEDVKTPEKLAIVAEKALRAGKPLIVTKIGRSEAGVRAAASHTASLAGSYQAYQAIFERYGVIEGNDTEEMVDIAGAFSNYAGRLPAGNRAAIFTGSGGAGGWMADSCAAAGLDVPMLDPETRADIDQHLPSYGTSQNPVDGTAGVIRTLGYARISNMLTASDRIDAVIAITSARNPATLSREPDALAALGRDTAKPVLMWSYTLPHPDVVTMLAKSGLPLFTNMRNCTRALAAMATFRRKRDAFLAQPAAKATASLPNSVTSALEEAYGTIAEYDAMRLLSTVGIDAVAGVLATSADEAARAAEKANGPVALKVQSPDISHKSAAGGVALNVAGKDAARRAFTKIQNNVAASSPNAKILGTLVQPMARPGLEMILGISNNSGFGPMLMAGFGGTAVE